MDKKIISRDYENCPYLISDGAGHYCKILKVPEDDYPHKYRRVFCYGRENGLGCFDEKKRFGLKDGLSDSV